MAEQAIIVENLSKKYIIGHGKSGSLSETLIKKWGSFIGNKSTNIEEFWALKDINLEVEQGKVLGIIGKNGAGKSTLLKILSRITEPTTGKITINGRISSLLEVGTGFHPELTGLENIFLNGTILGMTRKEVKSKFDEIIDFSGVEKFIDTPVKHYSSGMYVRLAFAVAAHLEPEILIIDEVLAVGDAEFQKKCLGKMKDVAGQGRTVLFVSHNMTAVKNLCNVGVLMNNGQLQFVGDIDKAIFEYLKNSTTLSINQINKIYDGIELHKISMSDNGLPGHFYIENDLVFVIEVKFISEFRQINVNIFLKEPEGNIIFVTCSNAEKVDSGKYIYTCTVPGRTLNDIIYSVDLMVVKNSNYIVHHQVSVLNIEGHEQKRELDWLGKFPGVIRPTNYKWEKNKIE